MNWKRREFIKLTGAGVAGLTLSQLGLRLDTAKAYAAGLKTAGAAEVQTICPFCAVGCNIIASVKDGHLVSTEGDPDCPINEGSLCAKGASLLTMTTNEHRLAKPLYRAPYGEKWEEKDWGWMLEQMAKRVKDTRDKTLMLKNAKGETVNRCESIIHFGSSHMSNEECSVAIQAARAYGLVFIDHQARI
jgi:formate dehydrogenase major subunit